MKIQPVEGDRQEDVLNNTHYVDFKWYVWKSHRKALIRFAEEDAANNAKIAFTTNPQVDGNNVIVTHQGKNIIIDDMKPTTD